MGAPKTLAQAALLDVPQVEPVDEHPQEFWPTPASAVRPLLPEIRRLPPGLWLGPCAGAGAILKAIGVLPGVTWELVELRPEARRGLDSLARQRPDIALIECPTNYLHRPPPPERYKVGIDNPPFSLAERFVGKMREECERFKLLLPFGFLATVERGKMHQKHPPDVQVLAKRPSFSGDGKTDSVDYAWFSWPGESRISWLLPPGIDDQQALGL